MIITNDVRYIKMIKGIGIDIIELGRIERSMEKQRRFVYRILTKKELDYYYALPQERRRIEFVAGRFAAKEAFAKATGRGIGALSFQHIEILSKQRGAPNISVKGYETSTSEEHTSEFH